MRLLGALFLLCETVAVPTAFSSFRLPKEALALTGLAVAVALFYGVRMARGRLTLPVGWLTTALAAYPALLAVSAIWAASPLRALAAAAEAAVWIGGTLLVAGLDRPAQHRLVTWTAIGTGVSATVMLLQAAGAPLLNLAEESARGRFALTGLAGNPADLAMSATLLLPLLLVPAAQPRRPWVLRGLALLLAVAIVSTRSLTALVALAAIALAWLVLRGSRRSLLVAGALVLVLAVVAVVSGVHTRVLGSLSRARGGNWYSALSARADGWTAAVQMITDRPCSGVGADHFTVEFFTSRLAWLEQRGGTGHRGEEATHFEWAHCDPLQVVAELGVAGLLWLLLLAAALVRVRSPGDPLLALSAAAVLPFAIFHFPGHLAVGLIPLLLILARLTAGQPARELAVPSAVRRTAPVVLALAALAVAAWMVERVSADRWRGDAQAKLAAIPSGTARTEGAALGIERRALRRLGDRPGEAPTLWRLVGLARLLRRDGDGAEQAFLRAQALWPHEESELGLGLALALQGRRDEAFHHLGRVCRVNPVLARHIEDPALRSSVMSYVSTLAREAGQRDPYRAPQWRALGIS